MLKENNYYFPGFKLATENTNAIELRHERFRLVVDHIRTNRSLFEEDVADVLSEYYYRLRPYSSAVIIVTTSK